MEITAFVDRLFQHIPHDLPSEYVFKHWSHDAHPTDEGLGLLPAPGVDPSRFVAAVLDVDHYHGNIEHVAESRTVPDPRFTSPALFRFYQRVDIPILGSLHHELVFARLPQRHGFEVVAWDLLKPETDALQTKHGIRSEYSSGAWLVGNGLVGYALSSAPRRDDVGLFKFKSLTMGADVAASRVVKSNIESMIRWAGRRHS